MTDLVNELFNDNGVCRTAMATPGPLNMVMLGTHTTNGHKYKNSGDQFDNILELYGNIGDQNCLINLCLS